MANVGRNHRWVYPWIYPEKPYCKPNNANQLAQALNIDYKTIMRHLDVLVKNGIITIETDGKIYFLSKDKEANLNDFNQIWEKIYL